jgi:KDO2-lipid IV(A) lauroyltransferase
VKRAPVRHRLEYAAYVAAKRALALRSHEAARAAGRRLGALAHRLDRRRRELALANLGLALPELPDPERRRIARESFEQFGAGMFEMVSAAQREAEEILPRFALEGLEHLEAARAGGRGVFMMTGHFGPWEVAPYPLCARFGPIHLVARPPDNPLVAADLAAMRERLGNLVVPKRGAARRMLTAVRRGGMVGILIDQRVSPDVGVLVPFFGRQVWTSPVLAYLSLLTRAPVIPAFCYPEGAGGYRMRLDPPIHPDAPERSREAETALTARYLAAVEAEIRKAPGLWLWPHRRWER